MTIRKQIIQLLSAGQWTARGISQALHVSEKEVYSHLEHVRRSMKKLFGIQPAQCLSCGFSFSNRTHVRCPGRCPRCKSEHVQEPRFFQKQGA